MSLQLNGATIEIDNEGYLLNTDDWSPALAAVIARGENMELMMNAWRSCTLSGNISRNANVSRNCVLC